MYKYKDVASYTLQKIFSWFDFIHLLFKTDMQSYKHEKFPFLRRKPKLTFCEYKLKIQ